MPRNRLSCFELVGGLIQVIASIFFGGAIIYQSKTQTLTAGSSTEAEFIAAVTAAKLTRYLRCILKQLGQEQTEPTDIYIDNQ